jgi:hypothetical protein
VPEAIREFRVAELHGHWVGDHHGCAGSCNPQAAEPLVAPSVGHACDALVVRPCDVLIVRYQRQITQAQADQIRARFRESLPDLSDVLLVVADQIAVYRPGDAP